MDKKNTLLLTVIAVATLLVAIVGATFAYFTAQVGAGAQAKVDVTTKTSDSLAYGTFSEINVIANQENFAKDLGSQRGTSEGQLSLKVSDADAATANLCYTVSLNITSNTFSHHPEYEKETNGVSVEDSKARAKQPELLFNIFYDFDSQGYKEITNVQSTNLGQYVTSYVDLESSGGSNELSNLKVCDNKAGVATNCEPEEESIKGWDITTVTNNIEVPNSNYLSDEVNNHQNVFKISGTSGQTVVHKWKAQVTFLNWSWDQQYNASTVQNEIAGTENKTVAFNGTLKFTTVDCSTGAPIQSTP